MFQGKIREYNAGVDIKKGQVLYAAEPMDTDTSEPLTLVYPFESGKQMAGVATHDAQAWQKIAVLERGMVGSATTTIEIIAGQDVSSGFVYIGKDGKAYNTQPPHGTRMVVAGADLRRGEMLVYSYDAGGYVPSGPGEEPEGMANRDAKKGETFEMILPPKTDPRRDWGDTEGE